MKYIALCFLCVLLYQCKQEPAQVLSAQALVNNAIETAGADKIDTTTITFGFRDKIYTATRQDGVFKLERQFQDAENIVRDVLSNEGFERFVNEKTVKVADSMVPRYAASVNSVHYFSVLPYGLNDQAVNKELLEDVSIGQKQYHTVKVTFKQDGGGEDFEDVFLYWINKASHKIDYLAYSYDEDDGKGLRFREAYNERYIKGIRFVDYNNYKPHSNKVALSDLPKLFEQVQLELLSQIVLEHVAVN